MTPTILSRKTVSHILKEGNEIDEFNYPYSENLGRGKHRQEIIYRGKPVGHLLSIEKNIFSDLDEIYANGKGHISHIAR